MAGEGETLGIPSTMINVMGGPAPQVPTQQSQVHAGLSAFMQQLQKLLLARQQMPQQGGMVSPPQVPQAQMLNAPPMGGIAPPGQIQNQPQQPISPAPVQGGTRFGTTQERDYAITQNAIGGLTQFVNQRKQAKDDELRQKSEVYSSMYLNAMQLPDGDPQKQQIMKFLEGNKEAHKILAKATEGMDTMQVPAPPPETHGLLGAVKKVIGRMGGQANQGIPQQAMAQAMSQMLAQRLQQQQQVGSYQQKSDIDTQAALKQSQGAAQSREAADEQYAKFQQQQRADALKNVEGMTGPLNPEDRQRYLLTGELPKGSFKLGAAKIPGEAIGQKPGTTWQQWMDQEGRPIPGAYQQVVTPASSQGWSITATTKVDPNTGQISTVRTKVPKLMGVSAEGDKAIKGKTITGSRDSQVNVLKDMAEDWAMLGIKPPGSLQAQVRAVMNGMNLRPSLTPTTAMRDTAMWARGVLSEVPNVRKSITTLGPDKLGPLAGRYNEFMAGKIGSGDPAYVELRTNLALLQTALMRAHVGARGGVRLLDEFKSLWVAGKMTPEALNAGVDVMERYLKTYSTFDETPQAQAKGQVQAPQGPDSDPLSILPNAKR